ncbi:nuclear transport factor 2 family protein [bacterium]|nr:nuclear transport factor 2 family protein [bacterium]
MLSNETVTELFSTIDGMDGEQFAEYLTNDGVFVWGQQMMVTGREQIVAGVNAFYKTIKSLKHSKLVSWDGGDGETMFVHGQVDYVLPNDKTVGLQFLNKFVLRDGKIAHYHVFIDPTPMFELLSK